MQLLFPPDDETQAYLSSVDALLREDLASIWYTSAIDLKETPDSAPSQRPSADFAKIRSFAQLENFRVRMLELKEVVFDDPPFTWGRFFAQLRTPEKFMIFLDCVRLGHHPDSHFDGRRRRAGREGFSPNAVVGVLLQTD